MLPGREYAEGVLVCAARFLLEKLQKERNIRFMRFDELDLHGSLLRAVTEMGFEEMTPIQAQAIPVVLSGKDIIGQAQTGTGKTAAFGLAGFAEY